MTLSGLLADLQLGLRMIFIVPVQRRLREPGPQRFAENFFPDGLVPTTMDERRELALAARCIGCGLCDAVPGAGPRPSLIPTVFSKASAELKHLPTELSALAADPERLEAAERLCPTEVPLRRLVKFLQERRARTSGG